MNFKPPAKLKRHYIGILLIISLVLLRLPALGHDNFNTDAWKWKTRIYDFGTGVFTLDFEKTSQKYHPGVTLMWVGAGAVKVFNLYNEVVLGSAPQDNDISTIFLLDFFQKLFIVVAIAISLAIGLYPLKKMFGSKYFAFAYLLVMLEPFFVALTRVVHLEGLLTTFMLSSAVWFYYWWSSDRVSKPAFATSAIFASLAVLTKT